MIRFTTKEEGGCALNRHSHKKAGRSGEGMGSLALGAAMLGISFSATLNKLALGEGLHPIWINALRLGFAIALMLLYALVRRRAPVRGMTRRTLLLSLVSGAFLAAHFVCWVYALKLTDALAAAALWSTYLFMTALGSVALFRERIPKAAAVSMGVAFLGVLVCCMNMSASRLSGNLFALGAAATQAGYFLCGRFVRRHVDNFSYTLVVYGAAFAVLMVTGFALCLNVDGLSAPSLLSTLGLAVFCTLLGHTLSSYALKSLSATTVSVAMLTEVVSGPLMVFLVLGEAPGRFTLIGGAIIILSVAWFFYLDVRTRPVLAQTAAEGAEIP